MVDPGTTGLAIGKFWPPHEGHHHLIEELQAHCDRCVVMVCATDSQQPSGAERALWLQGAHPTAEVIVVDDRCAWHHDNRCELACTETWVQEVRRLGLGAIGVVATSEDYGERFAAGVGARHVSVDPDRRSHPISGTAVRGDLSRHWESLRRGTRMGLVRRVVVLGAESTGTSTLAAALSRAIGSPLVAEVGRTVSWRLYAQAGSMESVEWTDANFWEIVDSQIRLEQRAMAVASEVSPGPFGPWIVCDTDTLATVAWWERYLRTDSSAVWAFAQSRLADLYLLTDPSGVAFDDSDPLRDGEAIRLGMHQRFMELLRESGRPWHMMTGGPEARLDAACETIAKHESRFPRWLHI